MNKLKIVIPLLIHYELHYQSRIIANKNSLKAVDILPNFLKNT